MFGVSLTEPLIYDLVIAHTHTGQVRFSRRVFREQNFGPNIVCLYKHVFYLQAYEDVFYHIVFEALGCRRT